MGDTDDGRAQRHGAAQPFEGGHEIIAGITGPRDLRRRHNADAGALTLHADRPDACRAQFQTRAYGHSPNSSSI